MRSTPTPKQKIARYTVDQLTALTDRSDYSHLDALSDKQIDYSDSPELDATEWAKAHVRHPQRKKAISLRVDEDVLQWFKSQTPRYQPLINEVLKTYMSAHRHSR